MKNAIYLFVAIATTTTALWAPDVRAVPEINPAALPAALGLLGGGILVARAYLKK